MQALVLGEKKVQNFILSEFAKSQTAEFWEVGGFIFWMGSGPSGQKEIDAITPNVFSEIFRIRGIYGSNSVVLAKAQCEDGTIILAHTEFGE